ncbi:GrpB family protein [Paenarthrobacter sp. NPDC090522]|uniref:GrpB family protein n=1 Tax=Paenarthrobacter sp. NPDC090522 TaxID=3364383 RepID=UPI00382262A4
MTGVRFVSVLHRTTKVELPFSRSGRFQHLDAWLHVRWQATSNAQQVVESGLACTVGATHVSGLPAKRGVARYSRDGKRQAPDGLDALVAAGYELRVREPGHRMVRTPSRDVHIHVLEAGDPAVDDYLLFRNRLRTDPGDRALYEETKRALLSRSWADMNAYAEAKTGVISAIKARARSSRT